MVEAGGAERACIVVTGASKGIGAAIAECLAEAGHHVVCVSRSGRLPERPGVAPEVAARWSARKADVTEPGAMAATFASLVASGWRIEGLVNNAGVHLFGPSAEMPLAQWREVMDTNATALVSACQAVYPHMVAGGGGLIVNIGSFFDKLGVKQNLAYCASKAAVGAITRCLAVEWAGKNIRVVNVAPGYIATDITGAAMDPGTPLRTYLEKRIPLRRPGESAEIGRFVAALYGPGLGFLTGETIYLDGGQSIAH